MGTSVSAISRLESGFHVPSLGTLRKLAAALGEETSAIKEGRARQGITHRGFLQEDQAIGASRLSALYPRPERRGFTAQFGKAPGDFSSSDSKRGSRLSALPVWRADAGWAPRRRSGSGCRGPGARNGAGAARRGITVGGGSGTAIKRPGELSPRFAAFSLSSVFYALQTRGATGVSIRSKSACV